MTIPTVQASRISLLALGAALAFTIACQSSSMSAPASGATPTSSQPDHSAPITEAPVPPPVTANPLKGDLTDGDDFRRFTAAAAAMTAVSRFARERGATQAGEFRDRAIELCEDATAELAGVMVQIPDDPWLTVLHAKTRVRLALLRRDKGDAVDATDLDAALATLAAAHDEVHACEWDEALFRDGQALLAR